ncbi:MAG: ABC transporter ATP-binding protein [Bacteroidales bacterium]|jgi:peptide/nickel transport system ATP-binding protein|nr:ABC transporter ATP-binding protein [Bacteroidales bacterium]
MENPCLIEINKLSIQFKNDSVYSYAVQDVSFSIKKGEAIGLVGESGSGKSITALAIIGLLPVQAIISGGQILYKGKDLLRLNESRMRSYRGNHISMIFQEPMTALNPVIKCGEQVSEIIRLHQHIPKKQAYKQVLNLFKKVKLPRPTEIYQSYPHQISGGQKQRVMIAMAVANKPDLLIADEPTTALDVTVQKEIILLLNELRREFGMSLLFISHDLGVITEVAERVAVMYQGKIVEEGLVNKVFQNPQHPYTKGLMACRPPLHGKPYILPTIDDFLENKPKEQIPKQASNKPDDHHAMPDILSVKNLEKKYVSKRNILGNPIQYVHAVNHVSFDVMKGETLGLVGESGCGKTTLGRSILRLIEPDSGHIYFDEKDVVQLSGSGLKKERKSINIIFQDPYSSLNPRLSIGEAIIEPMKVHRLYKDRKERRKRAEELLEKVGLKKDFFNRYPHEFSGGQRQRIVIARALALNPKFIICDEAVSALDVSVQARILNLLNSLKREFGFTYIFISHDLSVVRYMSDRIMVMKDGKIIETGEADQVYFHPQHEYTKKLISSIPVQEFSPF